jgi:hypothetical protein
MGKFNYPQDVMKRNQFGVYVQREGGITIRTRTIIDLAAAVLSRTGKVGCDLSDAELLDVIGTADRLLVLAAQGEPEEESAERVQ